MCLARLWEKKWGGQCGKIRVNKVRVFTGNARGTGGHGENLLWVRGCWRGLWKEGRDLSYYITVYLTACSGESGNRTSEQKAGPTLCLTADRGLVFGNLYSARTGRLGLCAYQATALPLSCEASQPQFWIHCLLLFGEDFSETGLCIPWLAWNSLCDLAQPWLHNKSQCLIPALGKLR